MSTLLRTWPFFMLFFSGYLLFTPQSWAEVSERTSELRIAIPYLPGKLDPLMVDEPLTRVLLENLTIGLTEKTATGTALAFATGMTVRGGGMQWVFELPEHGRFVSGRPITAKDIKDAYDYYRKKLLKPSSGSVLKELSANAENISDIIAVDPQGESAPDQRRSIQFMLKKPDPHFADFLPTLGILEMAMVNGFGSFFGDGTQFSSAGPYRVRENRGDGVTILEMPNLLEDQLIENQRLTFRHFATAEQALKTMRSGEIDLILLPTVGLLKEAENDPGIAQVPSPFLELRRLSGEWQPFASSWGESSEANTLVFSSFLVRKSLLLDARARARFAFATCTPGCAPLPVETAVEGTVPAEGTEADTAK